MKSRSSRNGRRLACEELEKRALLSGTTTAFPFIMHLTAATVSGPTVNANASLGVNARAAANVLPGTVTNPFSGLGNISVPTVATASTSSASQPVVLGITTISSNLLNAVRANEVSVVNSLPQATATPLVAPGNQGVTAANISGPDGSVYGLPNGLRTRLDNTLNRNFLDPLLTPVSQGVSTVNAAAASGTSVNLPYTLQGAPTLPTTAATIIANPLYAVTTEGLDDTSDLAAPLVDQILANSQVLVNNIDLTPAPLSGTATD